MLIECAWKHKYAKIQFWQTPIKGKIINFYSYEGVTNMKKYSLKNLIMQ